jgi:hypothetical protein
MSRIVRRSCFLGLGVALVASFPVRAEEKPSAVKQAVDFVFWPIQEYREELARQQAAENLRRLALVPYQPPVLVPHDALYLSILPYIEQPKLNIYMCPSAVSPTMSRLGAAHEPASEALASQLSLPKDVGQLVGEIEKGKAADKAGLRTHDVLLQLDGKDVPRDAAKFMTMLTGIKPDQPVNAVVLRKGKRVEVKGLSMPKAAPGNFALGDGSVYRITPPTADWLKGLDGASNTLMFLEGWGDPDPNTVVTTTSRDKERFTAQYRKGTFNIIVRGNVKDGKATLTEVSVWKDREEKKYETLDKVPQEHRDRVRRLLELTEKSPE